MAPRPYPSRELTPEQARRKKRLERLLLVLMALGLFLLTAVQRYLLNLGPGLSSNQGVITLVSINFSVLILGFMLYLILRGLYRIFFEHRNYGSLQTKMVVSFIGLSLLPTLLIFYFAYLLIGQDHDTWFGSTIKETMNDSLALAEMTLEQERRLVISYGDGITIALTAQNWDWSDPAPNIKAFLEESQARTNLKTLEYYDPQGELAVRIGEKPAGSPWPAEWLLRPEEKAVPLTPLLAGGRGLAWPLYPGPEKKLAGFLVIYSLRGDYLNEEYQEVRQALAKYQAAVSIRRPFRVSQLASLAGVTLLAIFLSIWIGSRLATSLAGPVTEMVEGTRRVARGELDFVLTPSRDSGEMAQLVTAFNQMTRELRASYQEIDSRRRFVEMVLSEVSSGVAVLNLSKKVVTINQAALAMLNLTLEETQSALPQVLETLLGKDDRPLPREKVRAEVEDKTLFLTVSRQALKNEEGQVFGTLLTFDDLSELEKAQRLAAWQEVAKRIAHEVKNPLTPISLAAQRLLRRFGPRLDSSEDGAVFRECTEVIIRQVENMRNLVSEFSQFARLPQLNPRPASLAEAAEEILSLFRQAHPDMTYRLEVKTPLADFLFDPEQMGRVITNLLANSTQAAREKGQVTITLDLDSLTGVTMIVADTGPGLPPEVKDRIFEPYVTSGEGGQGLGLAIVRTIINDHGGFIRVTDNKPQGTAFIIQLPYLKT
ncbi:MAG: HAMP domain-containing protein [Deltaproteobacteria bacterium]|jgi:two-component system nitrogen regulation sensor histidine kinase NtrY|nr:HAMP domain-containing protein [Deltaproteobacteria bacterium]